jgi:transposase
MDNKIVINGTKGRTIEVDCNDSTAMKMAMLFEGNCFLSVEQVTEKYGFSKPRYYQLQKEFKEKGSSALINKKRGSSKRPTRTKEVVNQIIRLRFLDPFSSAEVIAQKMNQNGYKVAARSVERTITEYGLQKKRIH